MNYKKEAEKIVEMFYPHAYDEGQQCMPIEMHEKSRRWHAIQCAIIYAELGYSEAYKQATEISLIRQEYWDNIINQLKQM